MEIFKNKSNFGVIAPDEEIIFFFTYILTTMFLHVNFKNISLRSSKGYIKVFKQSIWGRLFEGWIVLSNG